MTYALAVKSVLSGIAGVQVFVSVASAEAESRVITMKDGSTVQGKLVSVNNGVYSVESPTLGTLSLKEADVQSVGNPGPVAGSAASAAKQVASDSDLQAVQNNIMADPGMMADLQAMANDPEVLALISDPAFMEAAQAKDMAAVAANPRTAQLMNNPKFKALIEKLRASGMGPN